MGGFQPNPVGDPNDPLEQQFQKNYGVKPSAPSEDEDEEQKPSFLSHLLGGLSTLAPNGGAGGPAGQQLRRQSVRSLLQDRLFKQQEALKKDQEWNQNYALKNRTAGEASELNRARVLESQTNSENIQKGREFSQAAEAGKLFTSGWQRAEQPELTGGESIGGGSLIPQAPSSTTIPGQYAPDTKGRPSITAGGSTLIPPSPEESADRSAKIAKSAKKDAEDEWHDKLSDFTSDPENADFVKTHGDDLRSMQISHLLGQPVPKDTEETVLGGLLMKANAGDPKALDLYKKAYAIKKPPSAMETMFKDDPTFNMGEEGLNQAADRYALTGQNVPGMGSMSAYQKAAVIKRAGERHAGENIAGNQAFYGANKGSLASAMKSYDTITGFERTARDNMDLAMKQMKPVVESGSPWINKPLREVNEKLLGDDQLPAFRAAQQVASNEYARITALAGQAGVLSDSARHEIMSVNPSDITAKQMQHVLEVYKTDALNRQKETATQISRIGGRFGGVNNVRNILKEDPDVMKEFPELGAQEDLSSGLSKPITPTRTAGPGTIPLPPPPPGGQTHLRMTGKDGKSYDRLYRTKDDAELIRKAMTAGAKEVK